MTLWTIPAAFALLCGLLAIATHLETRRVQVLVRMTVRARSTTPELAEALIAAELAPLLAAHGIRRYDSLANTPSKSTSSAALNPRSATARTSASPRSLPTSRSAPAATATTRHTSTPAA